MDEAENYFDYVINVLGIKSIYIDSEQNTQSQKIPLLFAVENYNQFNAEEKELLEKMISALKIDLQLIKVIDQASVASYQSDFTVHLVEKPHAQQIAQVIETYSPRVLVKQAALKKNAWADFQKVIQFFNNK